MRVLVTGASGNAGTALLNRLHSDDAITELRGLCRRPPAPAGPYAGVDWFAADLACDSSPAVLREAIRGVDAVVHLAWQIQPGHNIALQEAANVEGTRRVVEASSDALLVVASSVGTYAPAIDDIPVGESWPTTGIATSSYSRQKAAVETLLDEYEGGGRRIARVRPGLVFQHEAGGQIGRYFLGPWVPTSILRSGRLPVLPAPRDLRLQVVASDDLADAYARILTRGATGAFNVAAPPVLRVPELSAALSARPINIPWNTLRRVVELTFRAGLQPTEPGWLDMARQVPVLDTSRAEDELAWSARTTAPQAFSNLVDGLGCGTGTSSPAMRPRAHPLVRIGQALRGRAGTRRRP